MGLGCIVVSQLIEVCVLWALSFTHRLSYVEAFCLISVSVTSTESVPPTKNMALFNFNLFKVTDFNTFTYIKYFFIAVKYDTFFSKSTQRRGQIFSTPASYSGEAGLKSRPEDRIYLQIFDAFSVNPDKFWDRISNYTYISTASFDVFLNSLFTNNSAIQFYWSRVWASNNVVKWTINKLNN